MSASTVFRNSQTARSDLFHNAIVEDDHAIGDIFFQPMARKFPIASYGGHDGRDAFVLESLEEPVEFRPQDATIAERTEQHVDRVDHHALSIDFVYRAAKSDKESFQVILAGFQVLAVDSDLIDHQSVPSNKIGDIETDGVSI